MATNWETLASVGTAAGTLVLAISTFASVRSANRAARAAERSLLAGLRPLLMPSRLQDAPQKVMFGDRHWVLAAGGQRVETRIGLVSRERHDQPEEEVWIASVSRHHNVDRPDPRSAGQAALTDPPVAPWRAALFRSAGRRRRPDGRA